MGLIDFERVQGHFEDENDVLLELIETFVEASNELLLELENNFTEKNYSQMSINAHSIKGIVSNFFAEETRKLALEIEQKAKTEEAIHCGELIVQLKKSVDQLVIELEAYAKNLKEEAAA